MLCVPDVYGLIGKVLHECRRSRMTIYPSDKKMYRDVKLIFH